MKRMRRISTHPFLLSQEKHFNSDIVRRVSQCYLAYQQSDIETLRFQWYFIRPKTAEGNITWAKPKYNCEAIKLAARRIKLELCPSEHNSYARLFSFNLTIDNKNSGCFHKILEAEKIDPWEIPSD